VTTGEFPIGVAVDQRTHTAYVANLGDNTVSVVNTATCKSEDSLGCGAIAPTVAVGVGPQNPAIDLATDTVYVPNFFDGTVSVIDGATCNASVHSGCGTTPPIVTVGPGPDGVAVDQATDTIYVTSDGSTYPFTGDTVSVIDGATCNAVVTSGCGQTPPEVTVGGPNPGEPAVDEATNSVYVPISGTTDAGNLVSVINGATCDSAVTSGCGQIPHDITVGTEAAEAAIDQATDTVYVTNFADDTVSVIDGATCNGMVATGCGAVPPTIGVGIEPGAVAVDQATGVVFVTNYGYEPASLDFTVSVFDGATCHTARLAGCHVDTVEVGASPFGVAVDDKTRSVYVTNASDNTLSVFRA
jgi:YVTN family beta-propeller protein